VVGSGVLNIINIRRVFDDATQRQQELFSRGREALGEFGTPLFGRAMQQLPRGQGARRRHLVDREGDGRAGYEGSGRAEGLRAESSRSCWICRQGVLVHCLEEAKLECILGGSQPRRSGARTADDDGVGAGARGVEDRAASNGSPLVRFDVAHAGRGIACSRFPIYINAEPTAAGAIAAEPPEGRYGYAVSGYDLAPIRLVSRQSAEEKKAAARHARRSIPVRSVRCSR